MAAQCQVQKGIHVLSKVATSTINVLLLTLFANASNAMDLCSSNGYVIGFFNGVNNTLPQAGESLIALESEIGESHNKKSIKYELLYNNTEGLSQDVHEVFRQRASEFKESHYEILTAIENGDSNLLNKLIGLYRDSEKEILELKQMVDNLKAASIVALLGVPLTSSDYKNHNEKLAGFANQNNQLLLVAHSQGNLFMNHAYDHILPAITKEDIRAVHIAPASQTLRGNYILSDNDVVIYGLRLAYGDESVPDTNVRIPFRWSEISGHALIDTYLNQQYEGYPASIGMMNNALFELSTSGSGLNTGFFRATVDLPDSGEFYMDVTEPEWANPNGIFRYHSKSGRWLDEFHSSCLSDEVVGSYSINFKNYWAQEGSVGTLTISNSKGHIITTKEFNVGLQNWRDSGQPMQHIADVVVSKSEDGKGFDVTLK